MSKRRRFSAEFKAKVALDVLLGEMTLSELSSKYKIHPNQILIWKKQAKESIVVGFSGKVQSRKVEEENGLKELHTKIGQLTVENHFLQKTFAR